MDCMNDVQYYGVLELLTTKVKKYRKPELKLHRIHETICRQAVESYLPEPSYPEFKSMFEANFITTPRFPEKTFTLKETGWLDVKHRYPMDIYKVSIKKKSRKN